MESEAYEKLGAFYLGREHDLANRETSAHDLLYDAKDLTTHALCVGMTGSGKTGLCLSLLEEAAIDGIPAIAVDPKGDLGNLLLTFPDLQPSDFEPWVDASEAERQGLEVADYAEKVAKRWRSGLASWGQDGERIRRLRDAVDMAIYTPGSTAGLSLTVLRSFDVPPESVLNDADAFRDRVASAASGLLSLIGVDIDPVQSREFILVSNLLQHAWQSGRDMDVATLIQQIQAPPIVRIGVMEMDTFYPAKDRMSLAMTLNSLLASPSFAGWLDGEPLDIKRLLYTPEGKPRISVLSIAHLSDAERMFFLTILLNELLTWVRDQPGTPSLRALFYMDEVFGYFPPVANPPSKKPMLTLLKQARAYGLGLVLATQNPVDLDYKGLSNCGTWFLGRLQTERDKARLLDGLEGASVKAGSQFDRRQMDQTLSALGSRVFLMNNVHDDRPVVFHTRWVMSYLRGPLTRDQIRTLMADRRGEVAKLEEPQSPEVLPVNRPPVPEPVESRTRSKTKRSPAGVAEGTVPPNIQQRMLVARRHCPKDHRVVFHPALSADCRLHYIRVSHKVDTWLERLVVQPVRGVLPEPVWDGSRLLLPRQWTVTDGIRSEIEHGLVCSPLTRARNYRSWRRQLVDYLYRSQPMTVWRCAELKLFSRPEEAEDDFRIRLSQAAHEARDEQVTKLRDRYSDQVARLDDQIRAAEARVEREASEYRHQSVDTVVSVGASIFGALFGRKVLSRTNIGRASSGARKAGRVARERSDVTRARKSLAQLSAKRKKLSDRIERDLSRVRNVPRPDSWTLEPLALKPRKSEMVVQPVSVLWMPWFVDEQGQAVPGF